MRDLLGGDYTTNPGNKNVDLNMRFYVGDKLGYCISCPPLKATLKAYYTIWANKSSSYNGPDPVGNNGNILYPLRNVNARHMGIELSVAREITRSLQLNAAILLSDWRWVGNGRYTVTDANNNVPAGFEDNPTYLDGVHVGDAAQNQFQIGLRYEPFKRFYIRPSFPICLPSITPRSTSIPSSARAAVPIRTGYLSHAIPTCTSATTCPPGLNRLRLGLKSSILNVFD